MSFTLIDFFNAFQSMKEKRSFLANTQSTYFAILAKFNAAHYPSELPITTRELKDDAGLKSVSTAHECRNVLKNHKLIDFQTAGGTTIYRLLTEHLPNKNTGSAEQEPNSERTQFGLLSIPAHGEVKKLERDESASARGVATATEPPSGANASAIPLMSPVSQNANDIQDEWEKAFGFDLRGGRALELEQLASADYERTLRAIEKARAKKPNDPFAYFKAVYDGLMPANVTALVNGNHAATAQSSQEPPRRRDSATADELRARMFDD